MNIYCKINEDKLIGEIDEPTILTKIDEDDIISRIGEDKFAIEIEDINLERMKLHLLFTDYFDSDFVEI